MVANGTNYSQEFIHQLNNAPAKQPLDKKFLLIGGGVLVALLIIILLILSASAPKPLNIKGVLGRTRAVAKIATDYHKLIDDTNLRSINSSLSVALTNFNRDGETYYQASTSKEQIKKEAKNRDADLSEVRTVLDSAELNNRLDRNYVIQISYQINLMIMEQEKLLSRAKNEKLIALLKQGLSDLKQVQAQLKELTLN